MSVVLYHNSKCSKSRQTLDLLRDRGIVPDIIEYLKSPPSAEKLQEILGLLGLIPRELMTRRGSGGWNLITPGLCLLPVPTSPQYSRFAVNSTSTLKIFLYPAVSLL